ncbi:MAG: 50S ribosome-binding GTPase [Helicobacter sp.]|nr:50S ribosome-binding GTPase [Helicobacter sp.]
MAELSAEERYNNADMEAFNAYNEACLQHGEHVRQYNDCLKEYERILDFHIDICKEVNEKAKTYNKAWENADSLSNVVVIGIMNHGKSTMLNALIGDKDDSTFKVADKRETKEIQREVRDGICWTDTPGFDADEDDDNKALAGIKHLKIGLFVHKASTGELHANEVEVLHKLANKREEAFLENTCIVLNDDISDDEKLEILLDRIDAQLKDVLGQKLEIFPCNPKSYQKGLREHKKILEGKSGIAELRNWIKNQCQILEIGKNSRIDQTARILEPEIRQKCKKAIEKLKKGIQDIEEQIQLAAVCSDDIHNAIKEINRNKDKMRGLRKEILDNVGILGGLMSVFGGGGSSDFDEKHNSNMGDINRYIVELNEKKNDIVESIRDFRGWQDKLRESIQNMQKIHESWE